MPKITFTHFSSRGKDVFNHEVSNREAALRVLKYHLQAARKEWADDIIQKFNSGRDLIRVDNGSDGWFRVTYKN